MNLSTPERKPLLRYHYEGSRVLPGQLIGRPISITRFELTASRMNPGKSLLVAQVETPTGNHVLMTESWTLIGTLRGTEDMLPHQTKIIRKRDGCYYFVELNRMELKSLERGKKNDQAENRHRG